MKEKVLKAAGWIVLVVTALFFAMAGGQKLAGSEQMVTTFRELGYADWFRIAVGLLEIACAVLLLVPRTTMAAAAVLGLLMIGAVSAELRLGNGWQVLLPGQWLIVSVLIVAVKLYRKKRSGRRNANMAEA